LKKRQTGRVGAVEAEFFNGLLVLSAFTQTVSTARNRKDTSTLFLLRSINQKPQTPCARRTTQIADPDALWSEAFVDVLPQCLCGEQPATVLAWLIDWPPF